MLSVCIHATVHTIQATSWAQISSSRVQWVGTGIKIQRRRKQKWQAEFGVLNAGQAGDWVKGTPDYIAPARIYMLVAMLGGYISSAALYFAAIPAVKHDIAKREAVVRAGGSPQVCTLCDICSRGACTLACHLDAHKVTKSLFDHPPSVHRRTALPLTWLHWVLHPINCCASMHPSQNYLLHCLPDCDHQANSVRQALAHPCGVRRLYWAQRCFFCALIKACCINRNRASDGFLSNKFCFGADHTASVAQDHLHCWDCASLNGDSSSDFDLPLFLL